MPACAGQATLLAPYTLAGHVSTRVQVELKQVYQVRARFADPLLYIRESGAGTAITHTCGHMKDDVCPEAIPSIRS